MFTEKDLNQLSAHGITAAQANAQMQRFATGFPYLKLHGSAAVGHGIKALTPAQEDEAVFCLR